MTTRQRRIYVAILVATAGLLTALGVWEWYLGRGRW